MAAARTLIAEKGVAGLRIQEITEGADVALGSFYNHFDSKEELVDTVVESVVSDSLADLAGAVVSSAAADDDPAVIVSTATRRFIRLAFDDPDFAGLMVQLNHADELFARAVHPNALLAVERGVAAGRFEATDVEVSVNMIVGASLALIRAILQGHHEDGAEIAHAELSLRALGVPGTEARAISTQPLAPLAPRRRSD